MITIAWVCAIFCLILLIFSFYKLELIIPCVLLGVASVACLLQADSYRVKEYVYNCIDKDAKVITSSKYNKTTSIAVDGKIFIIKNKNVNALKCEGVTK